MPTRVRQFLSINPKQFAAILSEYLGTLLLAFGVSMVSLQFIVSQGQLQPANQLLSIFAPIVLGGLLTTLIYALRPFGTTHFNPAVTLALFVSGEVGLRRLLANVLAQVAGAFSGFFLVKAIYNSDKFGFSSFDNLMENLTSFGLTTTSIAILEAIGAFILVLAVVSSLKQKQQSNVTPIAIGAALALAVFFTQQFTFGIINPAVAMALNLPVLYWIAPLLGGVVAAIVAYVLASLVKGTVSKTEKKN